MSEGRPQPTMSDAIPPGPPQRITQQGGIWLLGLLVMISVLLAMAGEPARLALRYERMAVFQGEYWRLVSGHFVHASFAHLLLNMFGLGLIAALFQDDYSLRQWLIVLAASLVAIDLGFVLFEPQLEWYVGLSGVLHGALAAGAVAWWRHEYKPLAVGLTVVLPAQHLGEQWQGALPLSGDMPVIVDAHLYGALGGLTAGAAIWLFVRRWPPQHPSL